MVRRIIFNVSTILVALLGLYGSYSLTTFMINDELPLVADIISKSVGTIVFSLIGILISIILNKLIIDNFANDNSFSIFFGFVMLNTNRIYFKGHGHFTYTKWMDEIDLYKERYFIKEYIGRFELNDNDIEGLNMRIRNRLTELKDQKEEYNKPTPKPIPKPSPLEGWKGDEIISNNILDYSKRKIKIRDNGN